MVVQDVRGRGTSDGTFEPFVAEEADGADTVAWVAEQPWCDGRVTMAGMSYVGATQWLAAAARPPALKAIAPTLSSDEFGEGWSLRSGVPEHGFMATWNAADLAPLETRWLDDPERAFEDAEGLARIAPWAPDWWKEPAGGDYWQRRSVAPRRGEIGIPALFVGGWYDIFAAATLDAFARSHHPADRLIVGPWGTTTSCLTSSATTTRGSPAPAPSTSSVACSTSTTPCSTGGSRTARACASTSSAGAAGSTFRHGRRPAPPRRRSSSPRARSPPTPVSRCRASAAAVC